MFKNSAGAKGRAASLHKALRDGSGFEMAYGQLLDPMAQAGGFASWHELTHSGPPREADDATWRRRLLAALPPACRPATKAWLNGEPAASASYAEDMPVRWYTDISPYWMASTGLHRRHTALIRRGSGPGQALRERLVLDLLLNTRGGPARTPRLDPRTLALVYRGDLRTLYRDEVDHPDFDTEFTRLTVAGVLDWRPDDHAGPSLRVAAPPGLQDEIENRAAQMALHWLEGEPDSAEGEIRLAQMLRVMGVDRPDQSARALLLLDAGAHIAPAGPMLTILSDLASDGALRSLALTFDLFVRLWPDARAFLTASLPAKVISRYLPQAGHSASTLYAWTQANPGWEAAV